MDDADFARYMALRRISHIERCGIVEGVEIDLRHELLDPREWQMRLIGDDLSKYRRWHEPFIWFPWFGVFDKEALRREIEPPGPNSEKKPPKRIVDGLVRSSTPECFVYSGDKIVIDEVERVGLGDGFDHPHDAEIRLAWLRIRRASGKSAKIKTPLMFTGATSILAPMSRHAFFYKIAHRICNHFGLQSLSEIDLESKDKSFAYGALFQARLIEKLTEKIRELAEDFSLRSPKHRDAFNTWYLVNEGVFMGYLWAKAEAELGLKPLAQSTLRLKIGGSLGGNKSGVARRSKRAKTWEPHARELAKSIRENDPSLSQDRVASEIEARWKDANCDPPGHKTLKGLISKMEKDGEIPTRKKAP